MRSFPALLAGIISLVALALFGSGCSVEPPAEVGAEIRGEPMRKPTNDTALMSTAAVPAVAASSSSNSPAGSHSANEPSSSKYKPVGFDRLSGYNIEVSDEAMATNSSTSSVNTQIPSQVRALDKVPVSLQGFMLPLKVQAGQVMEMLIMKDQSMCCYGTVPRINEWVSVKMTGDGVKPIMDQPVTIFGTLHVGEMRENGYLVGIYSLDGEKMAAPAD